MKRVLLFVAIAVIPACQQKAPPPIVDMPPIANMPAVAVAVVFPELGDGQLLEDGIRVHKLTIPRGRVPMKLWVYLPKPAVPAKPDAKLPVVFIAPAGSPMMYGLDLADDDAGEHLPYARQGYVVVAYSLDGHVAKVNQDNDDMFLAAVQAYKASGAGRENARTAIDFAMAKLKIDPDRTAIVGHSSAATHSLMVARLDPRIKACVSYAPCLDVVAWLTPNLAMLESEIPGFRTYIASTSPVAFPTEPKCPTFLFHAKDDTVVKYSETSKFVAKLGASNPNVQFLSSNTGGHTQSMYDTGIPAAIEWLDGLFAEKKAK